MAITFGTPVTGSSTGGATKDLTLTVASDDDYLVACVSADYDSTIDSVVLDPGGGDEAAFTQRVTRFAAGGGSARTEIWGLYGAGVPSAGSYTVRFTISDSADGIACGVMPLKGAAQEVPEATGVASQTGATTCTVGITTTTDGAVVFTAHGSYQPRTTNDYAANQGQTKLYDLTVSGSGDMWGLAGYDIVATADAITRSYTGTDSRDWDNVAAAFAPAAAGGTSIPVLAHHYRMLQGVG